MSVETGLHETAKRRRRTVLLLSATVTPPPGVPLLQRTDPEQRLNDYAEALRFYLTLIGTTFDAIVFAENSSYNLDELKSLAAAAGKLDQVEFLSFAGLDHPPSYGRGYGEFKLVDYAMEHAAFLQDDVCVWKCTGRYIVRNLAQLAARRPTVEVYCHLRNIPTKLCDLYLMSFTGRGHAAVIKGAYRHLRNDAVQGTHTGEEVAFRRLMAKWPESVRVAYRFNCTPLIVGVRGWNNAAYSERGALKHFLRRAASVALPWLWI